MVSLGRQDSSPPCQAMSALHAVPLTAPIFLRPSPLLPCEQNEQSNFHSPYTLPSSVSCKSSACHSYENTGGVGVFFPFWNSLVGCWGFDPGNECLSKSSTDCRQLSHCHSCFKSFRCNTYKKPGGYIYPPRRSDFSTFRCAVCIPNGVTGRADNMFSSHQLAATRGYCHRRRRSVIIRKKLRTDNS